MKKYRKPLKFYLTLLGISSILIFAYSIYRIVFDDATVNQLYSTWFLPPFFVLIYYGSDWALDKIFNRKKKVDYEKKFLDAISERMRKDNAFTIEDYRRLQINDKFQKSLSMAYIIYKDGEHDHFTIEHLRRKFDHNSTEGRALEYVVHYIEENIDKDGKKDQNKL